MLPGTSTTAPGRQEPIVGMTTGKRPPRMPISAFFLQRKNLSAVLLLNNTEFCFRNSLYKGAPRPFRSEHARMARRQQTARKKLTGPDVCALRFLCHGAKSLLMRALFQMENPSKTQLKRLASKKAQKQRCVHNSILCYTCNTLSASTLKIYWPGQVAYAGSGEEVRKQQCNWCKLRWYKF
jgi:hypothetical protein